MRERVAKCYARWSGLDEFVGVLGLEHARLSGHDGVVLYTAAGK
jgi:hypothetical protein